MPYKHQVVGSIPTGPTNVTLNMGEIRLLATVYHPSAEEAEEVLKYVLRETAKHAKIDPERIALKITKYQAVTGKSFGDGYWRPDGGDLLIDGKEPDRSSRADMK